MTEDVEAQEAIKEEVIPTETQEKDKEFNFSQVRKQLKERDDYIINLKKEMDSLRSDFVKSTSPKEEEEELDDDDFITKKHLKKYAENIATEKYHKLKEQENQQNWKRVAREMYADFDSVVSSDNLKRLEDEMPEIAKIISESKDNLKMASGAYKAIKNLLKESSIEKEIKKNNEAMEKNKKDPIAVAAIDRRPIAQAARLTDKDYQELWKEMQHYASKV